LPQPTKEIPAVVEIGGPFAPVAFDMAATEALRELLLADRDKAVAPPFHVITTPIAAATVAPGQAGPNPGGAALRALGLPAAVLIMIVFLIVSLISLNNSPFNRSARAGAAPPWNSAGRPDDVPTILYVLTDTPAPKPPASGAGVGAAELSPAPAPGLRPSEPTPTPATDVRPPALQTRTQGQLVGLKPMMTIGNRQQP
jgi:hypothetical protein